MTWHAHINYCNKVNPELTGWNFSLTKSFGKNFSRVTLWPVNSKCPGLKKVRPQVPGTGNVNSKLKF